VCGAALAAFDYLAAHPELSENLKANNRLLRDGIRGLGIAIPDSPAPIVPILAGGKISPRALSDHLYDAGIVAPFSQYPGSPAEGMVRLIVTAGHGAEQIGRLVDEIGKAIK
jgi:8-amino-7-oxononanoate synthase